MNKTQPASDIARIPNDPGFGPRLDELRTACLAGSSRIACDLLWALHADADRFIEELKRGLFRSPLVWTSEQKAAGRWISLQHHRLARNARRVVEALAKDSGASPDQLLRATALGLHHMAEAMKCEMAEAVREPRHFATLHAFMERAFTGGWHDRELILQVQAQDVACTVESLYFRTLLLARSGGVLTLQQVEILDAWIWMWLPQLHAVTAPPDGPWLRADLGSNRGLGRGDGPAKGATLHLPLVPLERAFRAIVQHFQNGEIVPADGHASRFRLEEHMVVLDLARRALRGIRREPVSRAERLPSSAMCELHVGIAEIMSRAFTTPQPTSLSVELVDSSAGAPVRREHVDPTGGIYEIAHRNVQVVDVSASGLGLEGDSGDCGQIEVGDVIALRLSPDGPLELGKVARRGAAVDGGRVHLGVLRAAGTGDDRVSIGVRQLSSAVQRLTVTYPSARRGVHAERMLYVPGRDPSGRDDAFLVAESAVDDRRPFEALVGNQTFTLGLNRVRDRGRGWVLSGFEIFALRKTTPLRAAA